MLGRPFGYEWVVYFFFLLLISGLCILMMLAIVFSSNVWESLLYLN
jgi:hypothetical protein